MSVIDAIERNICRRLGVKQGSATRDVARRRVDDVVVALHEEGLAIVEREDFDRIQFLIDWMDREGLLPEHCFTFPDGETYHATNAVVHLR